MVTISEDTDVSEVLDVLGPDVDALRESPQRQSDFEKLARLSSRNNNVTVGLADVATASVRLDETQYGKDPHIRIPIQELDQPATDFSRKVYDFLAQRGYLMHEVGHILYSDWPSFSREREKVEEDWEDTFAGLWNALEDGAIERQLAARYYIGDELEMLSENLGVTQRERLIDADQPVSVLQAIQSYILDTGRHDTGIFDIIIDENDDRLEFESEDDRRLYEEYIHEQVVDAVKDFMAEPDAIERNRLAYNFFRDIKPLLKQADKSGKDESDGGPGSGMGNDASEGMGGSSQDADQLSEDNAGRSASSPDEIEERSSEDMDDGGGNEELEGELEKMKEAVWGEGAGPGKDNYTFEAVEPTDPDTERWSESRVIGDLLAERFRASLQHKIKPRKERNLTRGRFNSHGVMKADMDNPGFSRRVKEKRRPPEIQKYSVMVIVDRSGSMSSTLEQLELSLGAVVYALQNISDQIEIDVGVIDLQNGQPRLAKPFGVDIENSLGTIFTGQATGGTPLDEALFLGRRRLQLQNNGRRFAIVITDDEPMDEEAYINELNACDFEVLGVYLKPNTAKDSRKYRQSMSMGSYFHALRIVAQGDNLTETLLGLATDAML